MSHPYIVRYQTSWVETETQSVDARQRLGALKDSSGPEVKGESDKSDDTDGGEEIDSDVAASFDLEAFEFDINAELDFLSTGHGSKSVSYPSIHFGNEASVSRAPPSKLEPISASTGGTDSEVETSEDADTLRTLYIQMEYIQGFTLREVGFQVELLCLSEIHSALSRRSTKESLKQKGMLA
jgi:translation initiation factor 2-alpha kinase 4